MDELSRLREELRKANEQLQQKDDQLQQKNEQIAKLQKREMFLSGMRSRSAKTVLNFLQEKVPEASFSWPKPIASLVRGAWRQVKLIPGFHSSPGGEDSWCHPIFQRVIEIILKSMNCNHYSLKARQKVASDNLIPDIIIGRAGVSSFTWADIVTVIELKLPSSSSLNDAIAQVCGYFTYVIESKPASDSRWRVAIASNLDSICFLWSSDDITETRKSKIFHLFPTGWLDQEEPSEGFYELCHALFADFGEERSVKIGERAFVVTGTLSEDDEMAVYRCAAGDNRPDIVVKVALAKRSKGHILVEAGNYRRLWGFDDMKQYLVPLIHDRQVENGFAMELASPIESILESNGSESASITTSTCATNSTSALTFFDSILIPIARHLMLGIKTLHLNHGFFHMDIRPGNMVMFQGTARLIDWASLTVAGTTVDSVILQGQDDPFWPRDKQKFFSQFAKWDVICFAYSIFYIACSRNLGMKAKFIEDREQAVADALTQETNGIRGKMARIIRMVEEKSGNQLGPDDYQSFLEIITGE